MYWPATEQSCKAEFRKGEPAVIYEITEASDIQVLLSWGGLGDISLDKNIQI